jgi:CIC family chloride channel protein
VTHATRRTGASWFIRLAVVTFLVGVGSGVAGIAVTLLLRATQHLAFGYSDGTFLEGVIGADPWRRVAALAAAGVIGGVGWWALRRWGRAVVPVAEVVDGARMPGIPSMLHAALQIVIVGLGASIGRELAPRELGALFGSWLSDRAGLSARDRRVLVAAGAGAGLAAVYNVPLGGAIFTLEVLLLDLGITSVIVALATSAIATLVARIVVPNEPLYSLPPLPLTPSLIVWACLAGPVLGLAGAGFVRAIEFAQKRRPTGWRLTVVMPLVFTGIGALAVVFPQLLGNGRALGQVAFDVALPTATIALLAVLKAAATLATIGSGASGGTLTPSLAIGAALGMVGGAGWNHLWPGTPVASFVLVAAAAFLAASMRAPVTALVLVFEFTNQQLGMLVPAMIAVAGSIAVARLLERRRVSGID